mmetsp:Transcript_8309/g.17227  ORF Transcript_8309/g.17227 Transcript_8309/m.17227 type:complete len:289 (-) Transcript_8309:473-1339(-)
MPNGTSLANRSFLIPSCRPFNKESIVDSMLGSVLRLISSSKGSSPSSSSKRNSSTIRFRNSSDQDRSFLAAAAMASCMSPSSMARARAELISLDFFFASPKLMDVLFSIDITKPAEMVVVPSPRSESWSLEKETSNPSHCELVSIPLASTRSRILCADSLPPLSSSSSMETPIENTNSPLSSALELTLKGLPFLSESSEAFRKASFNEPTIRLLRASFIVLETSPSNSAVSKGLIIVSVSASSSVKSSPVLRIFLKSFGHTFHLRVELTKYSQYNPASSVDSLFTLGP